MDPVTLAASATALLAPFVAKAGERLLDQAAEALPEQVGRLWSAISRKSKGRPAAEAAILDLVRTAKDPDNQEAFSLQVRKLLKEDSDFAQELETLFTEAKRASIVVAGEGGIAIGGNVSGNIVIGDNNTLTSNSK